MAWSRPFHQGAFFAGGFFGGTGTTAGFGAGIGKLGRRRTPEEERRAREEFGVIPPAAMRIIAMVARRYALGMDFDERALREELVRELRRGGFQQWSSDYLDAALAERERLLVEGMSSAMRLYRIAPCLCGGLAGWSISNDEWEIACPQCGGTAPPDERPIVALRNWNAQASR